MITDPTFKVTADGIAAPTYAEILEYFQAKARAIFGTDINLDADTQDGQMIAIFASALSDVNAQAIAVYNAFNPNTAQGVALDSAVKTNGLARRDATPSQVDLTLTGQVGTTIIDGAAMDANRVKWLLPSRVVIPSGGEITVSAKAETTGAIEASAGTITTIATPTLGWHAVTNRSAAVPGVAVETDIELRARQADSTALPSVSLWEGIIGSLLSLDGVLRVSGIKNDEDSPTPEGVPGHSIAMIVDGGDTQAIGETIFRKKGEGVGTHGDIKVTYLDSYGFPNYLSFSRPKTVRVKCKLKISPGLTYLSTVADEIKARVAEYVNSLAIGDDVGIARVLAAAIKDSQTGIDTRFTVDEIQLGRDDGGLSVASLAIAWAEAAACSTADVEVEVNDERQRY